MKKFITHFKQFALRHRWFLAVAFGILGLDVFASVQKIRWLTEILSFIGILASVAGVKVAFDQIKDVKTQTREIKKSTRQTRHEIDLLLNHGSIGHLIEVIRKVEGLLTSRELKIADVHLTYLKDDLTRLHSDCSRQRGFSPAHLEGLQKLRDHIETGHLQICEFDGQPKTPENKKGVNVIALHRGLEKGLTILVEIETYFKHRKL